MTDLFDVEKIYKHWLNNSDKDYEAMIHFIISARRILQNIGLK